MKVTKAVFVDRFTPFDPKNPGATDQTRLILLNDDAIGLECAAVQGMIMIGTAEVEITLHSAEEATKNAVTALTRRKESVLASAQAEATEIERQIQNLLAITHEG